MPIFTLTQNPSALQPAESQSRKLAIFSKKNTVSRKPVKKKKLFSLSEAEAK